MCDSTLDIGGGGGHTLDCKHVTPVQSHPGYCGHRIPGAGSGRWLTLETVTSDPRYIV